MIVLTPSDTAPHEALDPEQVPILCRLIRETPGLAAEIDRLIYLMLASGISAAVRVVSSESLNVIGGLYESAAGLLKLARGEDDGKAPSGETLN